MAVAQPVATASTAAGSSCRAFYLSLGVAAGRDLYRDQGTSPLSYPGFAVLPDVGLRWERPRWRGELQCLTGLSAHADAVASRFAMDAIGLSNRLQGSLLRKATPSPAWRGSLLYGIDIANQLYVRYNTHHQNAGVGVSNFTLLGLHGALLLPLGKAATAATAWTLQAEASLYPVALVVRPGYAFIDNYTGANNLYHTFGNQYQCYAKAFCGAATALGVGKQWPSGHSMSLSYQWQYLHSGTGRGWRYENASHYLCCRFCLLLRRPSSRQ